MKLHETLEDLKTTDSVRIPQLFEGVANVLDVLETLSTKHLQVEVKTSRKNNRNAYVIEVDYTEDLQ